MRILFIKINSFIKGLILFFRPYKIFGILTGPVRLFVNTLELSRWISNNNNRNVLNHFYTPFYDYLRRFELYKYLCEQKNLYNEKITFLEFGVSGGNSFKWWIKNNKNQESKFFGFDTFEGLPESWGVFFKRGEMEAQIPELNDARAKFIKGLFQNVLKKFVDTNQESLTEKLVIHMDADLYSSTLYVLTNIAGYLKKGDIIIFDEFGVPNHEFLAFKNFTESFYIKYEVIGVVNNFMQVAFQIK